MKKATGFINEHKIEISAMIAVICAGICAITFTVHSCMKSLEEAGGFRTIIVESGKKVKLIANDINKAVEDHYEAERNDPYR
jgi:hypothetical protein